MKLPLTASKRARRIVVSVLAIALLGGGYYLLRYQAWNAYRNWSVGRMNVMARDFISANDPRNALLIVRKVLGQRPNDAEAWRLGVKAADSTGSNEAVLFQRNLCRIEKTTANYLELMRLAVKYKAYSYAVEVIPLVAHDAVKQPEFHRLAADVYRRMQRNVFAKYQLLSLLSLAPNDTAAQVALAETEFDIDPSQLPADWPKRVEDLTHVPEAQLAATLLQLRSAVARHSAPEAAVLAAKLQTRVDLTLEQRLRVLQAAYLYDAPAATALLADLQRQAAATPADVVAVMDFLSSQSKPEFVRTWYPTLPEAIRQDDSVKLATANALQDLHDWPDMEELLRGGRWKNDEFMRLALLAEVYRITGRSADSADSWKVATIAAGTDGRKISRLLRCVEVWQWDSERYELVWKLFNLTPTNTMIQQFLIAREYRDGKTVNLNKIYARVVEANPADESARNNFAYTSLLLDTNPGRAHAIAQELFKAHPEIVAYRTTYALSLYKKGQAAEALAVMEKVDPIARVTPVPMVHEAAYAAATGKLDRAAALLADLQNAKLLPEQQDLATGAGRAIAQRETVRDRKAQVIATAPLPSGAPGGWLALLSGHARDATDDFKLADSYYREKKYPQLRELLAGGHWGDNDHLRYALMAYVERAESKDTSARNRWSQAFATAGRDAGRLQDLEVLTGEWHWVMERHEVIARQFERDSSNQAMLTELLDYYRANARTAEMARVLWLYVDQTRTTGPEAAWCVYYSLLCGLNVSPAQILAARAYGSAPKDARHQVAYAFALWRQKRPAEALELLKDLAPSEATGMKPQLVEAGALLELGRKEDAKNILNRFTPVNAMPEEITLAATLSRLAGLPNATIASTLQPTPTI